MTFLNPLFLLGLAAAAIPLIIHLFNFRRPRRIDFSSLSFLHELKKSTMQRVRIKQWLLLALRTLAIAFLVLAFARPTLRGDLAGSLGGRGRTTSAIIIDNSTSMTLRDGGGEFLEQARTIAARLIEDVESGDDVYLVPVQGEPGPLVAYQNASVAVDALLGIEPMHGATTIEETVRRVEDRISESVNLNRVVYVLSDFQRSTFANSAPSGRAGQADTSPSARADDAGSSSTEAVDYALIPVGTEAARNIAVTDVAAVSQIVAEGQPATLRASFMNSGNQDLTGLVASLFLDDERVAQATLDVVAGGTATAEFVVTPRQRGWLRGRVEVDDSPYEFDDSRLFALHVPEQRSILVVSGDAEDARFLELALSQELADERVQFDVRSIRETALASEQLGTFDAVILSGVRDLTSGERAAIGQYVTGGGGLLIFPSRDIQIRDYNTLFSLLGAGRFEEARNSGTDAVAQGVQNAVVGTFDDVDTEHPLFEGMFEPDPSGEAPTLEQPTIYRITSYRPGGQHEQSLIQLTGDEPFLQEIRPGRGSVLLYAVGAGVQDSDLPVRGLFVPMVYRSLYYLSSTGSVTGASFRAGEHISMRLPGLEPAATVEILNESGEEYLPEQRRVPGAVVLDLEGAFFQPGFYEVRVNEALTSVFVVQPPPAESDLSLIDRDVLTDEFENATGIRASLLNIDVTNEAVLESGLSAARTGVELWNVFLGLALSMLMLEMVVARQWRPEAA